MREVSTGRSVTNTATLSILLVSPSVNMMSMPPSSPSTWPHAITLLCNSARKVQLCIFFVKILLYNLN